MDYIVWISIALACVLLFGLVFVWPMTLYNVFWVAVTNRAASLPIYYQKAGFPQASYYSFGGSVRIVYGLLCLTSSLSLHIAVIDLIMNSCSSCYATPIQKYSLLTWLATVWILALSGQWVMSYAKYAELDQDGELFF